MESRKTFKDFPASKGGAMRLATVAGLLLALLTALVSTAVIAQTRVAYGGRSAYMSQEQARRYMVELINRDRASCGLPPVRLDPTATKAAQEHSDEMAVNGYVSHWDTLGRKPDQRYNESGGTGAVFENVYTDHDQPYTGYRAPLAGNQVFSRRDIEQAESWFFNQRPPHDRHRRNILDANHQLVGIGLSRSLHRELGSRVTVAQEFVHKQAETGAWSTEIAPGSKQKLYGRLAPNVLLAGLQLCAEKLPAPMSTRDLKATGEYNLPNDTVACYTPDKASPGSPLAVKRDASGEEFSFALDTDSNWKEGLYYLIVWVRDSASAMPYIGATRTVRIARSPAPASRTDYRQIASSRLPADNARTLGPAPASNPARLKRPWPPVQDYVPLPARPASQAPLPGGPIRGASGPLPQAPVYYAQASPLAFPVPEAITRYAAYVPLSIPPLSPRLPAARKERPPGQYTNSGSGYYPGNGPSPLMRNPAYVPPGRLQAPAPARLGRQAQFIDSVPKPVVKESAAASPDSQGQTTLSAPPQAAAPEAARQERPAQQGSAPAGRVWSSGGKPSLCPFKASD